MYSNNNINGDDRKVLLMLNLSDIKMMSLMKLKFQIVYAIV